MLTCYALRSSGQLGAGNADGPSSDEAMGNGRNFDTLHMGSPLDTRLLKIRRQGFDILFQTI
jgi:hypothetical protein